jgi:CrcB protein
MLPRWLIVPHDPPHADGPKEKNDIDDIYPAQRPAALRDAPAVPPVTLLWLALGGAIGTVARYAVTVSVNQRAGIGPWGTFAANISGSLLIGFLAVLFNDRIEVAPDVRRFLIIGVLGGYTTFSTLAYDTARFIETGELERALLNAGGSLVVGVLAVFLGMALGRALGT